MNLFILSLCFAECAEAMFDKHISKMILEAVQMLCTAKRVLDPTDDCGGVLYKIAHLNHPTTRWIRESYANYTWTLDMVDAMHTEWKYRYNHPPEKIHKSFEIALILRSRPPLESMFPKNGLTPFAQAMPDEYKREDAVEAYRAYYMSPDKRKMASWKRRNPPKWYIMEEPKQ